MRRYLISTAAIFVLSVCASAQTGAPPFASFTNSQFDAINNGNGNVIFAIPVMSSPGRGLSLSVSVGYNSLIWVPAFNGGGALAWAATSPGGWQLTSPLGHTSYQSSTTTGSCGPHGDGGYTDTTIYNGYTYVDSIGTPHSFSGLSVRAVYNSCTDNTTYSGTYSGYAGDDSGYYASISNPAVSLYPSITSKSGVTIASSGYTVTDTNGNFMTGPTGGSETDWTDSTGRTALKVILVGSTVIKYEFLDPTGNYQTTTLNLAPINIKTNFGCSGVIEFSAGSTYLPSSLVLPNGQSYQFSYEPTPGNSGYYTGRLQRVTLPTGGYYEYDYTGSHDGINCADGSTVGLNQVVSDGTNSATWNFVRNTLNLTTTITTPKLADTPNAFDTVFTFTGGQATQQKIYKESPGVNVLRTINTTWASNGTPATRVTLLEDGSTQSEVDTTYDSNGLLDSASEYDWGSGARGNLLRTTTYTYQTSANYTGLNIIDRVISKQIKDGSGIVQYRQDITYDATGGDNQGCPAGIAQHNDSAFGCTFFYRGNPTSVTTYLVPGTPANGITKNFTYDFFGNLRTAQLNCCQSKTWGYSSASTTQNYSLPDSVKSGSSPSLTTTYAYYLPTGQVNTATDPNGLVTTFSYDYLRRVTLASQTSGPSASVSYDDVHFTSTTTATIDSSKSIKQITALDTLGRPYLATTEDASNNIYSKVTSQYDLGGRVYQTSDPYAGTSPSYWTMTAFDVLGRPKSVTLPDNSATSYSYSVNTATITDPAGIQRKSVADGVGRLSSIYEPNPPTTNNPTIQTSYAYNVLDELTQITQSSQTRTYVYDALGRLFTAATPEAGTVCFGTVSSGSCQQNTGYDAYDNLQYRTDARGVVTNYVYDGLNRLTSVSYNVGTTGVPATSPLAFTYGNDISCNSAHGAGCIGQLITMTDGVGSENYTYNSLEQLTKLQKIIGSLTYTTQYAYNLGSQLTSITYPSGRVVQQSVDAIGRLCEVAPITTGCGTSSSPFATGLGYSTAGQMTSFKYGNGIYASFGFSTDRLQLNCLDYSTTNRGGTCTHDGTTKFGLSYSYAASPSNNGLISGITDSVDNGRTASYTYDSLYRLLTARTVGSANYPAWGLSETYDRYGNRTTQSAISGTCVSIACPQPSFAVSTTTNRLIGPPYAYDASGNMTNDGINTLIYDAENHATSSASGSGSGTYTYDGNGQRVIKVSSGTTIVTIFAGANVLAEYNNGAAPSSPTNEYIYAGSLGIASIQSGTTNYWHNDHLSPRVRTDTSGNVSDQRGTFPFGETWYSPGASPNMFTSYYRDYEAAGNDYAQARYDVSGLGRFSSPDPVSGSTSNPQSLNRYTYVRNMPVILTDPLGTCPGGFAEIRDLNQQQQGEEHGGGPFQPDTDPEAAPAFQNIGHWMVAPGPCPGWTDQGGGGGMGVNNFTTLDGEDIGQIPSGLMGSGQSNDTFYGFGLGFSLTMENGPFGAYFNPQTEGCYGSSALGGITCGAIDFPNTKNPANPFRFSDVFGQLWPPGAMPPPTSFTLLPDQPTNSKSFSPPPPRVPKPAGNAPPRPGNVTPNLASCNPALMAAPGIMGGTPSVYPMPASGTLFLALPSVTLLQGVPGLTCSP